MFEKENVFGGLGMVLGMVFRSGDGSGDSFSIRGCFLAPKQSKYCQKQSEQSGPDRSIYGSIYGSIYSSVYIVVYMVHYIYDSLYI